MILTYRVSGGEMGRGVYSVLRSEMGLSETAIRRLKRSDAISVNGRSAFTNERLDLGDVVAADVSKAEPESGVVPERGDIEIIYEDEGLVAVNKPAGLLTHPSRAKYTGTLANFVAWHLLERDGAGQCHAVNRLDRDTSGVVLFAKNSHMKALTSKALSDPDSEKEYIALVFGEPDEREGTVDLPIIRLREGDMMRGVSPDGQRAVTRYVTLGSFEAFGDVISLVRMKLETGRTHQIRVHFLAVGNPVLGDGMYYTERSCALSEKIGIHAQALHARRILFREPFGGEMVEITAQPPLLFDFALESLGIFI